MFINFWYVAEESKNLADKPVHVRMLGQDFVLFRDSTGAAHCLSNICIHRGGSLADGRVKGDCVQCPYHGWQFDGTGACRHIPSLGPDDKMPIRRIDAYPTTEKYGLVFAFLGDLPEQERCPIMDIPEWEQDDWRATFIRAEWDMNYMRSMENAVDPAHNEHVHTTHIDKDNVESFAIPPLDLIDTEWGTGFHIQMPAPPLQDDKMKATSGLDKPSIFHIKAGLHGISSFWTYIQPHPAFLRHSYFFETPVERGRTRVFFLDMRNAMTSPQDDERVVYMDNLVMNQDAKVLLGVRPVLTPRNKSRETLVPADKHVVRFREFVKNWQTKGWRIDCAEVRRTEADVAYAIPSPARRDSKGWVLDSIPLLPGKFQT